MSKIVQIIPAEPGWKAAYLNGGFEEPDGKGDPLELEPIVCWGLVEHENGDREVVGIAVVKCCLRPVDHDGIWRYISPHGLPLDLLEQAKEDARALNKK